MRQLRDLRESALTLAHDKLPSVIGQLRAGQQVDPSDYEPGEASAANEIEQVQHAFNIVQQTAVQSAIDEARLDVERTVAGLWPMKSEQEVVRSLEALNERIRRAHFSPAAGPSCGVAPIEVAIMVSEWRRRKASGTPPESRDRRSCNG